MRNYIEVYGYIMVYFKIVDAWQEAVNSRTVYKFKLELIENAQSFTAVVKQEIKIEHNRLIPPQVKLTVWQRDKGRCVVCGSTDDLHFDHIIPFSKGGSSLVSENIQLLCARHNIAKRDKIE